MTDTITKIITALALIVSIVLLPWWILMLLLAWVFFLLDNFYAGFFIALIMDIYYGHIGFLHIPFPFVLSALVVSILAHLIKQRVVFWNIQ